VTTKILYATFQKNGVYMAKNKPPLTTGRPKTEIDWEYVEKLARSHCTGTQIAANIGVHHETLYDRVEAKYGKPYSQFSQEMKQNGISLIKEKQFDKAISGDNMMLIWVGKNFCEQSDNAKTTEQHAAVYRVVDYSNAITQKELEEMKAKLSHYEAKYGQEDPKD
jgi:hypothetical protein